MEFKLVSGKELPSPGTCRLCGSGTRDSIDLGFDIDDDVIADETNIFGRNAALMCIECFEGLAKYMGYIPEPLETSEDKDEEIEEYQEQLRQARLKANELFDILSDVSNVLPDFEFGSQRNPIEESLETEDGNGEYFGQDDQPSFFERPDDLSGDSSDEPGDDGENLESRTEKFLSGKS